MKFACVLLLNMVVCVGAFATDIWSDNFSAGPVGSSPTGWAGSGATVVVDSGNNVLQSSPNNAAWVLKNFSADLTSFTNPVALEFDIKIDSSTPKNLNNWLRFEPYSSVGQWIGKIGFIGGTNGGSSDWSFYVEYGNGYCDAYDGSGNWHANYIDGGSFDVWYNVKQVWTKTFDAGTGKYNVRVDYYLNNALAVSEIGRYQETSAMLNLNQLYVQSFLTSGMAEVDNFKMYETPEPATMVILALGGILGLRKKK